MSTVSAPTAVTEELPPPPEPGFLGPVQHTARVDLLPPEVVAARHLHRTQKVLAGVLALALAGAGLVYWSVSADAGAAASEVALEQSRAAALASQQAQFSDVTQVDADIAAVTAAQQRAMAGDVRWADLLSAIDRSAPQGVWLTDVSISVLDSAASGGTASSTGDLLAKPAIASISFNGYAADQAGVAAWLDALTAVPGLSDARFTTSAAAEVGGHAVTSFSSTVGVTDQALSHRFEKAKG